MTQPADAGEPEPQFQQSAHRPARVRPQAARSPGASPRDSSGIPGARDSAVSEASPPQLLLVATSSAISTVVAWWVRICPGTPRTLTRSCGCRRAALTCPQPPTVSRRDARDTARSAASQSLRVARPPPGGAAGVERSSVARSPETSRERRLSQRKTELPRASAAPWSQTTACTQRAPIDVVSELAIDWREQVVPQVAFEARHATHGRQGVVGLANEDLAHRTGRLHVLRHVRTNSDPGLQTDRLPSTPSRADRSVPRPQWSPVDANRHADADVLEHTPGSLNDGGRGLVCVVACQEHSPDAHAARRASVPLREAESARVYRRTSGGTLARRRLPQSASSCSPRVRSQRGGASLGSAHSSSSAGSRCQPGMPPRRKAMRR